jgi:ribose 5-phosphate isomerase A
MSETASEDSMLRALAEHALRFIDDGMVVGLGTGRAAAAFVDALGRRVQQGLHVKGVPTSKPTARAAEAWGIPLVELKDVEQIDVTVDGADEVDPDLDLIKGYGGALVPEKIVAAASRTEIILVGSEKLVPVLGQRGILPVEVIPFAAAFCARRLTALDCHPRVRQAHGETFVSDSGNYILDCTVKPIREPQRLEDSIRAIPGVVGTGLFLGIADRVLVGDADGVREKRRRSNSRKRGSR